ncbi:hypothetical protein VN24_24425 [Paenibacillus beijingensis]|uniref:GerMN domain-containing protein n=1 Tax=Paenibacillus beijingensis TaxID=1126833 RepID=A0A0D5NRN7_9BACL|nr:hypothetical protein VN24_24425 [Paenibacillus beijingensis]
MSGNGTGSSALSPEKGSSAAGAGGTTGSSGTGGGSSAAGGTGSATGGGSQPNTAAGTGTTQPQTKQTIDIYMTDANLEKLYPLKAEIGYTTEESKIKAALEALAAAKENGKTALWSGVKFNGVTVKDGAVTADITLPETSRLGAPGEELALESIQKTLFQFAEIKSIDILVDGKAVDSLMGHLDLEHPITRSGGQ